MCFTLYFPLTHSQANFGHVVIPVDFIPPSVHPVAQSLGQVPPVHAVQADAVNILDTRRIEIVSLSYDGTAPGETKSCVLLLI